MTRNVFSRLARLALCLALAALLGGCLVPERYSARIKIERDGSYRAYAEGTAAHPEAWRNMHALNAEARAGKLKPEELAKAKAEALAPLFKDLETLRADKRFDTLTSIGDGRVRFSVSGSWRMNRNLLVFNELKTPLSYAVGADGTLRIRVKDAVAGPGARALGLSTEGTLNVSLAEGVEVLEHNAQKAPSSHLGAYRWSIGPGSTEQPYLKIRLPEAEGQPAADHAASGQAADGQHPGQATGQPAGTVRQSPAPTTQKKLAHP